MVRGNKGTPQCANHDEEARRTGLEDEMGRHAGVHSGSRSCFVTVRFDPFSWRDGNVPTAHEVDGDHRYAGLFPG